MNFAANQNNVDFDAIWQKNVENLEELSELEKIDCQDKSDAVEEESGTRDVPESKATLQRNPGLEECSAKTSKLSSVAVITVLRDSGTRKISFINIINW